MRGILRRRVAGLSGIDWEALAYACSRIRLENDTYLMYVVVCI